MQTRGSDKKCAAAHQLLHAYQGLLSGLFFFILALLLALAGISTCYVSKSERIFFLPDSPLYNLLAVLVWLVLLLAARRWHRLQLVLKHIDENEASFFRVRSLLLWIYWFAAAFWVLSTRIIPGSDQEYVFYVAEAIAQRDFSPTGRISYLYNYNNQLGLVMTEYVLNRFLGEHNYIAYQLINAGCIVFIAKNLSELSGLFGMSRWGQICCLLLCMLFPQLFLYATFIYGTIPGLLLALLAIKYEIRFFRGGHWCFAILSAACIGIAVMIKMNFLIFMTAMLIYGILACVDGKKLLSAMFVLLIAASIVVQARLPMLLYRYVSGSEIPTGTYYLSWVCMGLQDGNNPGWWNRYVMDTFEENGYDGEKQKAMVLDDLQERLTEMREDPEQTRKFFVRKTASQWNEPSFESLWISLVRNRAGTNTRMDGLLSPQGNHILTQGLNYWNTILLVGALLYVMLCRKKEGYLQSLILPLIFVGGFVFHLAWEAKGQYVFPYFLMLLPCAAMGFSEFAVCGNRLLEKRKSGDRCGVDKRAILKIAVAAGIVLLVLWLLLHGTAKDLTKDSLEYSQYLIESKAITP